MELYGIILFVFFGSFLIFPIFFLARHGKKARKILFGVQLVCFVYWNVVYWGSFLFYGFYEGSLAVPSTSDPEGSIFMLYIYVTPIYAVFVIVESLMLWRTARRLKKESDLAARIQ